MTETLPAISLILNLMLIALCLVWGTEHYMIEAVEYLPGWRPMP